DPIKADNPLGLYQKFHSDSDWNRAAARRFLEKRLLGSTVIRAIVNRTPPLFTSNHAVFFTGSCR
ncbi:MAG: radical SAM protein, partial [Desulfuromonadales bacterium]|nr:radical SAM protein [Desulfuromonadales bacterium]